MKKLISLLLTVALAFSMLAGCSGVSAYAAAPKSSPAPEADTEAEGEDADSKESGKGKTAGVANPVTEFDSIDEINDEVGCCIKSMEDNYLCGDVSDESFSVIDGAPRIAQYCFSFAGIPVTVRAAVSKEDISGVHMDDGKLPHEKLDSEMIYDPIDTGCGIWTRWFTGGMQYSLLVGDGKDYSVALTKAGYGNLVGLITDLRDYQALVFHWYQEPYYQFEDWGDEYVDDGDYYADEQNTDFEGTFACSYELAQMNALFGKNFGTGTKTVFSEMTDYKADKHKKTVTVSDIDALLKAIAPDTEIILEPGEYNISEASNYGAEDGKYYTWEENYDGYELVISADNLAITGPVTVTADGLVSLDSLICTDPRYSNVLSFRNCRNIELAGLTVGHSLGLEGYCTGGVIYLSGCKDVTLTACELYGCGTYGIEATDCSELEAEGVVIRSCTYGHTYLTGCSDFEFEACFFLGTAGYTGNCMYKCKAVSFTDCSFAYNTMSALFCSDKAGVKLKNCFMVNNVLEEGIFSPNSAEIEVKGGACVEPGTEEGAWTEIACG